MLIPYVRCMRYAIKKCFGLDYSDFDVMSSRVERVQSKCTPFSFYGFPKQKYHHRHCYSVHGTFLYFRFWNKNHYDYYMIDIPSDSFAQGFSFFDFKSEV